MVYKIIGLMSGSSLDGLDLVYVHLHEKAGTGKAGARGWEYEILASACYRYSDDWKGRLAGAVGLSALDYQLLHTEYGHYLGQQVLRFIAEFGLEYKVQLIASHGHTTFHLPARRMTAQLGDGAAIAAATGINVVGDLRAMDVALGGEGAPIVPRGEELLLGGYDLFLNVGGIANISMHAQTGGGANAGGVGAQTGGGAQTGAGAVGGGGETNGGGQATGRGFVAFDICPANRILNELAEMKGMDFDEGGKLAAQGEVDEELLARLNELGYYAAPYPKSLANDFGMKTVLPMVRAMIGAQHGHDHAIHGKKLPLRDALRTYVEHVGVQIREGVRKLIGERGETDLRWRSGTYEELGSEAKGAEAAEAGATPARKMLVTGGGAHNTFMIDRLRALLEPLGVEVVVPEPTLVDYKEALVMALLGALRWREEYTVLASVTGASRDSIGGAVWIGQGA